MFDNAVIKNCLVYRTTVSATRTGQISSDTKSGNRLHRCFTDGGALVSSDSYAKITDSKLALDDGSLGSGEIAFELNDTSTVNPNPVWFQNITKGSVLDSVPVLTTSGHGMVFKKRNGNFTNDGVDLARLGDGTPAKPFLIGKPEDLQDLVLYIGTRQLSNFYVLQTADIDMKDKQMLPIGSGTNGFEGHYDGTVMSSVMSNLTRINCYWSMTNLWDSSTTSSVRWNVSASRTAPSRPSAVSIGWARLPDV
jgi:hypothetical protein